MASDEAFHALFAASKTPQTPKPSSMINFFVKESFSLRTLLTIGGLFQTIVTALLPARYSILPLAILLFHAIITTILQSTNPRNTFISDIIPGRTTTQLPSAKTGLFSSQPGSEPFVVFHLGVRLSHPLGVLSPGAKEIGQYFLTMMNALNTRADEFGMMGSTSWRAGDRGTNNTLLIVFYFRDVDGLNKFAHDSVHRVAWDWYRNFTKKQGYTHIGVFHETFVTRSGDYETVYVNMPPTMLGAANVKVKSEEVEGGEGYVRPLVDANHKALRSQRKRMGTGLELRHELSESERE